MRRLRAATITEDTEFDSTLPYQLYDSLVVAEGVRLTLKAGTTLCFHDKAMMIVRGTLISEGTVDEPVTLAGDRTGNVVTDISFDIMSRQWTGLFFTTSSTGNVLTCTDIKDTWQGLTIEGTGNLETPQLTLLNCRLRSGGLVLEAYHSRIDAVGCEMAEAADGSYISRAATTPSPSAPSPTTTSSRPSEGPAYSWPTSRPTPRQASTTKAAYPTPPQHSPTA